MYHPFTCHAPFNNLVLCPDYFSGTRLHYNYQLCPSDNVKGEWENYWSAIMQKRATRWQVALVVRATNIQRHTQTCLEQPRRVQCTVITEENLIDQFTDWLEASNCSIVGLCQCWSAYWDKEYSKLHIMWKICCSSCLPQSASSNSTNFLVGVKAPFLRYCKNSVESKQRYPMQIKSVWNPRGTGNPSSMWARWYPSSSS